MGSQKSWTQLSTKEQQQLFFKDNINEPFGLQDPKYLWLLSVTFNFLVFPTLRVDCFLGIELKILSDCLLQILLDSCLIHCFILNVSFKLVCVLIKTMYNREVTLPREMSAGYLLGDIHYLHEGINS